jgi:hypothetical protein
MDRFNRLRPLASGTAFGKTLIIGNFKIQQPKFKKSSKSKLQPEAQERSSRSLKFEISMKFEAWSLEFNLRTSRAPTPKQRLKESYASPANPDASISQF